MEQEDIETKEKVIEKCKEIVEQNPLLIIGSGLSTDFFPSMSSLANELIKNIEKNDSFTQIDKLIWSKLKTNLENNLGLEVAIDSLNLRQDDILYDLIRQEIWIMFSKNHYDAFLKLLFKQKIDEYFPLIKLLKYLFDSDKIEVKIITTNYDRLIELSCSEVGIFCDNFFSKNIIGSFDSEPCKLFTNNYRKKFVRLYKVHGSLDWFKNGDFYFSISDSLTENTIKNSEIKPLIIPPSANKNSETHDEPYRSLITMSDKAINDSKNFMVMGYGFNDKHIQTKLLKKLTDSNINILVLAKSLTDNIKKLILKNENINFVILTHDIIGTKVFMKSKNKPLEEHLLEGLDIWNLHHFTKEVLP